MVFPEFPVHTAKIYYPQKHYRLYYTPFASILSSVAWKIKHLQIYNKVSAADSNKKLPCRNREVFKDFN